MIDPILELAYQLTKSGEPFVLATVVWCERPTSAKPGARAIIRADGQMTGWIGGSCAQPVVLREAARLLREGGESYLLRLGVSETETVRGDLRTFPMSCASGGVLDIYMEPHFPQPQLLLIGDSPVIAALSRLAPVLNFSVSQFAFTDFGQLPINEQTYMLVASHGQYDEDALEKALRSPARYVGMVASRRRADTCRDYLRGSGLTEEEIKRLKAPAGLDVGAATPEEIAASILAELVQVRRRGLPGHAQGERRPAEDRVERHEDVPAPVETAIDPICGMTVEIATARHRSAYEGRDYYFCCPACKRLFENSPQEYLVKREQ